MPKKDENGLYSFYLAKTDIEASTDSIVVYIMEHFKKSADAFKIVAFEKVTKHTMHSK